MPSLLYFLGLLVIAQTRGLGIDHWPMAKFLQAQISFQLQLSASTGFVSLSLKIFIGFNLFLFKIFLAHILLHILEFEILLCVIHSAGTQ